MDFAAAIAAVPPGRWGIAVSGGADSVALLHLLRGREDLALQVVHLDHELRGDESAADAAFVQTLASAYSLPATIARRSQSPIADVANRAELYRRARLELYRQASERHDLDGVLLAHHRDDQVETVLHRLLRGSGYRGLCGMRSWDRVSGVTIRRPLLDVPRATLRDYLQRHKLPWREDSSNFSNQYARNRLRRWLRDEPVLVEPLLRVMATCRALRDAVDASATEWPEVIELRRLTSQPRIVREQSARAWLQRGGTAAERIDEALIERLLLMIDDAASPARTVIAGGRALVRRAGRLAIQER